MHLRIEKDWLFVTRFCDLNYYTPRRCFTPSEVGALTRPTRERAAESGTLLLCVGGHFFPLVPAWCLGNTVGEGHSAARRGSWLGKAR